MIGTAIFTLLMSTAAHTPAAPAPISANANAIKLAKYGNAVVIKDFVTRFNLDGEWITLKPGETQIEDEVNGKPATRRFTVRMWWQRFKYDDINVLSLTMLTYEDYRPKGKTGWILEAQSISMDTTTMVGDYATPDIFWDEKAHITLPVIGARAPSLEQIKPYLQAGGGETFKSLERYVVNSTIAAFDTYIDNPEGEWVLPIWPDRSEKEEIRFLVPMLAEFTSEEDWDEIYFAMPLDNFLDMLDYIEKCLN